MTRSARLAVVLLVTLFSPVARPTRATDYRLGPETVPLRDVETNGPLLAADNRGNVYVMDQTAAGKIVMVRSSDGGETWGAHVVVADPGGTPRIRQGDLVCDDRGDLHLVWIHHGDVLVVSSEDHGESWSTPSLLNTADRPLGTARIDRDERGHVYVVWQKSGCVSLAISEDDGRTWEPEMSVGINCESGGSGVGTLECDASGLVFLGFQSFNPLAMNVQISSDFGQSFDPVQPIDGSVWPLYWPALSIAHNGTLGILFGDVYRMWLNLSLDRGQTFLPEPVPVGFNSSPSRLGGSSTLHLGDGGRAIAAWEDLGEEIFFSTYSADGGLTWAPQVALSDPNRTIEFGRMVTTGNGRRAIAAFSYGDQDEGLYLRTSIDGGETFSPPVRVDSSTDIFRFQMLANDLGEVYLAWADRERDEIHARRVKPAVSTGILADANPTVIPPGERLTLETDLVLRNSTSAAVSGLVSLDIVQPDGSRSPVRPPRAVTLAAHRTRRGSVTLRFPRPLPSGVYRVELTIEGEVSDQSILEVIKE